MTSPTLGAGGSTMGDKGEGGIKNLIYGQPLKGFYQLKKRL